MLGFFNKKTINPSNIDDAFKIKKVGFFTKVWKRIKCFLNNIFEQKDKRYIQPVLKYQKAYKPPASPKIGYRFIKINNKISVDEKNLVSLSNQYIAIEKSDFKRLNEDIEFKIAELLSNWVVRSNISSKNTDLLWDNLKNLKDMLISFKNNLEHISSLYPYEKYCQIPSEYMEKLHSEFISEKDKHSNVKHDFDSQVALNICSIFSHKLKHIIDTKPRMEYKNGTACKI